jgi:CRP/FNR family transcriptional regulator, cyclic AMP receptor protein
VNVELLQQHPLCQRLSAAQIQRFAAVGELELFQAGEDIVVEGTLGDSCYLILSGQATVHSARVSLSLATLKAGEFFGEMSLLEPAVRSATVRAAELCEVFRVPNFSFANFLGDDSGALGLILVAMVRALSERLRRTNQLVGSMEQLSVLLAGSLV